MKYDKNVDRVIGLVWLPSIPESVEKPLLERHVMMMNIHVHVLLMIDVMRLYV